MSGYSGTPLQKKLGLKPKQRIALLGAPAKYLDLLGPLPEGVVSSSSSSPSSKLRAPLDLVQQFVTRRLELEACFESLKNALARDGSLWICWPKGKQKAKVPTDLDENQVREVGLAHGLVDVKVCAVDDVWSGLKFVYRVADR